MVVMCLLVIKMLADICTLDCIPSQCTPCVATEGPQIVLQQDHFTPVLPSIVVAATLVGVSMS
jgi:hypothetical protein